MSWIFTQPSGCNSSVAQMCQMYFSNVTENDQSNVDYSRIPLMEESHRIQGLSAGTEGMVQTGIKVQTSNGPSLKMHNEHWLLRFSSSSANPTPKHPVPRRCKSGVGKTDTFLKQIGVWCVEKKASRGLNVSLRLFFSVSTGLLIEPIWSTRNP